jgi:1-acyl-sn-glycerol-3-phosphate acyltransferase
MERNQTAGIAGTVVDKMIRRSVRKNFHGVWWAGPSEPIPEPCIFVPNHHGWFDGYLMYHAVTKLSRPSLCWIAEFDAFPLFRHIGGLPFSPQRPLERAATIRTTIRRMRDEKMNLLLFAEGVLHRPPEVLTFRKSLDLVYKQVPEASVVPVAIRYEMSMHERPEAFLLFGQPVAAKDTTPEKTRLQVKGLLDRCAHQISFERENFLPLAQGTQDVNERWDMRKASWPKRGRCKNGL